MERQSKLLAATDVERPEPVAVNSLHVGGRDDNKGENNRRHERLHTCPSTSRGSRLADGGDCNRRRPRALVDALKSYDLRKRELSERRRGLARANDFCST